MAIDAELSLANDEKLEADLAGKYLARLGEVRHSRDQVLKGLVSLDALLALAVSGKNIRIPGTEISMSDIPALLEILVGLSSAAVYICSFTFTSWLCYSQIYFVFNNRIARKAQLDPDLINFAETISEPTLKMFRTKLNIWGIDWHEPGGMFKIVSTVHGSLNLIFLLMMPLLHFSLMFVAVRMIVNNSGFDFAHSVFYIWVIVAHILALFSWIVPSVTFTFIMKSAPQVDVLIHTPDDAT